MKQKGHLEINDETTRPDALGFSFHRQTWMEGIMRDGKPHSRLTHRLELLQDEKPLFLGLERVFETHGDNDNYFSVFNRHWDAIQPEFQDIIKRTLRYYSAKQQGGNSDSSTFLKFVLSETAPILLELPMDNADIAISKFDTQRYLPFVTLSRHFRVMRDNAQSTSSDANNVMKLDAFEKAIIDLEDLEGMANSAYYSATRLDEDDMEDPTKRKARIRALLGETGDNKDGEDWSEPLSGPVDERDNQESLELQKADALWDKHEHAIRAFTDAANILWFGAMEQIRSNPDSPIKRNEEQLQRMHNAMEKSMDAYHDFAKGTARFARFKTTLGKQLDLNECYDLLESDTKGQIAKMEVIMNMAEKSVELGDIIKNSINTQRDRENERKNPIRRA